MPTLTLVSEYPGARRLVHVDLYRIGEASEPAELGLDDLIERKVIVVEWGERLPPRFSEGVHIVNIDVLALDERHITVRKG